MISSVDNPRPNTKKRWAWMWLAYTGFLFIEPIMDPSRNIWLATLVSFSIFVVIFAFYVSAYGEDRPIRFWLMASTYALGLATFPWNQGGSTYFIYTAAFIPFTIVSVPRVLALFAVESLGIVAEHFIFNHPHSTFNVDWPNAIIAIGLSLVIGGSNIFFAEQKRHDCKLREAQEENVALAAVAERERIARDLHDVLGHTLSVIVLKAELAGRLMERDPQRAAAEIAEVERTARNALAEVREAIGGYRARGLVAEIEAARRTLDAAGVTLKCDAMPMTNTGLRAHEETVLALALREAVTNIVRHARATTCTLRFHIEDNQHRLSVEDDGQNKEAREGNGLRGMRERVEALGGRVSLDRSAGTRLLIALPAHAEGHAR
jgi:two-component system, NarL family, sensor histidine kinase DesK